jgi:hypothetical protein
VSTCEPHSSIPRRNRGRRSSTAQSGWHFLTILPVVFAGFIALVVLTYVAFLARESAPIVSDFGRDLVGVDAIQRGESPYQRLVDIVEGPTEIPETWWVAHSPVSIAVARAMRAIVGSDSGVESVIRFGSVVAAWLMGYILARRALERGWRLWEVVSLALLLPSSMFLAVDVAWVQTGALVGLGLAVVLMLDDAARERATMLSLGCLVAWRPWLAPLIVAFPTRRPRFGTDLATICVAISLTLLALPAVGGWDALAAWLTVALPANVESLWQEAQNYSISRQLPLDWVTPVYALTVACVVLARHWVKAAWLPVLAALVALTAGPISWNTYLLAVLPLMLWPLLEGVDSRRHVAMAMLLVVSAPIPLALGQTSLTVLEPLAWGAVVSVSVAAFLMWGRRASQGRDELSDPHSAGAK